MLYISEQTILLSRSLKEAFSGNSVKIVTTPLLVYLRPFPAPGHIATALLLFCFVFSFNYYSNKRVFLSCLIVARGNLFIKQIFALEPSLLGQIC